MQALAQNIKTTILRREILDHLTRGRAESRSEYVEALDGFQRKYLAEANRVLKLAKKGEFPDVSSNFGLVRPRDVTREYDEMIAAFEVIEDEKLEMNLSEVSIIVNNRWNFTYEAKIQNAVYSASAARSLGGW